MSEWSTFFTSLLASGATSFHCSHSAPRAVIFHCVWICVYRLLMTWNIFSCAYSPSVIFFGEMSLTSSVHFLIWFFFTVEFLHILDIKIFVHYIVYKYFLLVCSLCFHIFHKHKFFYFNEMQLSVFFFHELCLWCLKTIFLPRFWLFSPIFFF